LSNQCSVGDKGGVERKEIGGEQNETDPLTANGKLQRAHPEPDKKQNGPLNTREGGRVERKTNAKSERSNFDCGEPGDAPLEVGKRKNEKGEKSGKTAGPKPKRPSEKKANQRNRETNGALKNSSKKKEKSAEQKTHTKENTLPWERGMSSQDKR